ncbi:MAG: hypothetical protein AOA65_1605 [Candidatus Bathyarchaeota archaeon BA1]|nr:MAG: hypothetical protein AOA65_1605 [Candidatus Bathyarchaeota archaeon BA1]
MWKRLLCKLGSHDWSKPRTTYISGSNVRELTQYCRRCGKQKRWIETV